MKKPFKFGFHLRLGMVWYRGIPIMPFIDLKLHPIENWLGLTVVVLLGVLIGAVIGSYAFD